MKKIIPLILCAALALTLLGCAPASVPAGGKALSIVTTIFPPYDFARAVTGGSAEVTMLIDPGAEVHTFDPTPDDIIKIQNADVFIYIGGENDAWVEQVLEPMDTSHKTILRLMDAVTPVEEETVEGMQSGHEDEEEEDHAQEEGPEYDEHIWTSPKNAVSMIDYIAKALEKADGANAEAYRKNAAEYIAQIERVDKDIKAVADASQTKMLVVADRFPFRYFTDEFGLDYRAAFSGCSSESEVSAGTLAYLIDTVKQNGIKTVFYIEMSNQAVAKAVCEQTGAQMLLLHSCHNVTKDDFESGVTYLRLMEGNLENLKEGLQ